MNWLDTVKQVKQFYTFDMHRRYINQKMKVTNAKLSALAFKKTSEANFLQMYLLDMGNRSV